jgi:hypothetical protein
MQADHETGIPASDIHISDSQNTIKIETGSSLFGHQGSSETLAGSCTVTSLENVYSIIQHIKLRRSLQFIKIT